MQLIAINGPLAGSAFVLTDGLTIESAHEGPQHARSGCRIRAVGDGEFALDVLDRDGSVFVNGLPPSARGSLRPGDEVRLGDSLFIARPDERVSSSVLTSCDVSLRPLEGVRRLVEVGFEEAVLHVDCINQSRASTDLALLTRAVGALTSVSGLASVDAALAGFILDVVPAERVVFAEGEDSRLTIRSAWARVVPAASDLAVDPQILGRAIGQRVALIVEVEGRRALVAPMMAFGRATGAAWTESRIEASSRLDEEQLRLLLAVTALAAVAREQSPETARLHESREALQAEINLEHNMVGDSPPMRALFDRIARIAQTDATVLLRGESGTGKELVARALHRNSARARRPFIAINCAALTESLLESELFGHERGAFTGAIGLKRGKLELADGGTLFLDEIGELPLNLQAKLLRAVQEREFERVGGTRPVRADFRLIAATNRDLEAAITSGTFRQDLFYRLNVVPLVLPALRDRKPDLPLLAGYFVRKHTARCGRQVCGIAPDVLSLFRQYDWPGNVRELENVIEQALVLGRADRLVVDDLPPSLRAARPSGASSLDYHTTLERTKRHLIMTAFEQAGRSHTQAARLLGVHPNYLHRLLRNLNLRPHIGTAEGRASLK